MHANKHVLAVIFNEFLTIKDILVLRKTCKVFQNLLQPNHTNMVTFCDYPYYKNVTDTTIVWDDVTCHFLFLFSFCIFWKHVGETTYFI